MQTRVVRGQSAKLSASFLSGEDALTLDGAVSVTITTAAGTLLESGTATAAPAVGTGVFTYDLGPQADVGHLSVVWAAQASGESVQVETEVDIVGGRYFTLAELRGQSGLDDLAIFPTWLLEASRTAVEDLIHQVTGVAWCPAFARETHDGSGNSTLLLRRLYPRAILSATVGGSAIDTSAIEVYSDGEVYNASGWGLARRGVVLEYEHGRTNPPADLRRAALRLGRVTVLDFKSRIPERAVQMSTEAGSFNLSVAGEKRPTGYPEIDAILAQHDHRIPGLA